MGAAKCIFLVTIPFVMNVLDFVSDWLMFFGAMTYQDGLVYGPLDKSVVYALLAFCIIGTLTFILEIADFLSELCCKESCIDTEWVSAITIWIEDVPQIAINVYIAWCREDSISVFQLVKASIVLLDLVIRIIVSLYKCRKDEKKNGTKVRVFCRAMIVLGLLINAGCGGAVFVFTQTERNTANNHIQFNVPQTLFDDTYNDQRYFQGVGIFFNLPDFDKSSGNKYMAGWIKLTTINDIRNRPDAFVDYNYKEEKTPNELRLGLRMKVASPSKPGSWSPGQCYSQNLKTGTLTIVDNATCHTTFFTSPIDVYLRFAFTPPVSNVFFAQSIFGDIKFNMQVRRKGQLCRDLEDYTSSTNNINIPIIRYHRIKANSITDASDHVLLENGSTRFYRSDGVDLDDMTEVWKTGWGRCSCSGRVSPRLDRGIQTECTNDGTL